jgi:hypothetical protein
MSYYHKKKFLEEYKDRFQKILIKEAKLFPIKLASLSKQSEFLPIIIQIVNASKELKKMTCNFLELVIVKFSIAKPSTKLQNWPDLDFKGFLGELKKAKVQLSLSEEAEWMAYFNEQKQKALTLQSEINRIDAEIDRLVYALYGLTEEEIRIVEGGEG